jgi:uncharacterized membrane protein
VAVGCLRGGSRGGRSHIEGASFMGAVAIGVLSFLVRNHNHSLMGVVISFVSCSLRKVEGH